MVVRCFVLSWNPWMLGRCQGRLGNSVIDNDVHWELCLVTQIFGNLDITCRGYVVHMRKNGYGHACRLSTGCGVLMYQELFIGQAAPIYISPRLQLPTSFSSNAVVHCFIPTPKPFLRILEARNLHHIVQKRSIIRGQREPNPIVAIQSEKKTPTKASERLKKYGMMETKETRSHQR